MSEQKAVFEGPITWSDGTTFEGFCLLGLVPPTVLGSSATKFYAKFKEHKTEIPQWLTLRVRNGVIDARTKVRYNTSISPPNTQYVCYFVDISGTIIATNSLFTVTDSPYTLVEPTLTVPTAGATAPTPCMGVSVAALSTPIVEVPTGTINGVNDTFVLSVIPPSFVNIFLNGQRLTEGVGFTISGNTITFASGYIPATGADLIAIIY